MQQGFGGSRITLRSNLSPQQIQQIQKAQEDQDRISKEIDLLIWNKCKELSIGVARVFAQTAAKFTPPNMGKAYIENRFYYRPVQELKKLAKGEYAHYHATKADYAALRAGYKFRVLNTKYKAHKKNDVVAYTKGINEAKRVSRIKNRGLSRYSWGNAINNAVDDLSQLQQYGGKGYKQIYGDLPPIFHRLLKKSPNIAKYQFGRVETNPDGDKGFEITFINKLAQIQRYGHIAIRQGTMAVNRWWNKLVRAQIANDQQKLKKIFDSIGPVHEREIK